MTRCTGEKLFDGEVKVAGEYSLLASVVGALWMEADAVAGRIMSKREASKKLYFYDLYADDRKLQVHATRERESTLIDQAR
jgi:lysyl-tRNA synthetase class II